MMPQIDRTLKGTVPAADATGGFVRFVQSPWFASVVIAAVTFTVFIRALGADFVMWDDDISIYLNPNLGGLSLERLRWIFTDVDSMMRYNPLTLLSWSITYHFFGINPFWYHFGNWLLHGLNASLVFLVLRKLLILGFRRQGDTKPWNVNICAAIGALAWSLHPLRVEVVAWANERTYCQSLFFLLISLWFYMRANEGNTTIVRRRFILAASVLSYVFSLLSHPIGAFLPVVLIVLDVYPLRRIGGSKKWLRTAEVRRVLWEKLPFIASALTVGLITVYIRLSSAGVWSKPIPLADFGMFERLMQAMYIWAYYIWRSWYPVNLMPCYTTLVNFNPLSLPFVASAIGVIGMIVLLVLLRRRWPLALALAICYLALLVPVLGIMEHPHYPCDRYSLIASICFSVLIAAFLANPKTKKPARYTAFFLSIVVIAILGTLSWRQTRVWNNSVSLFEYTIRTLGDDPYSSDIHDRLGKFYAWKGQYPEAIEHFQKTIEIYQNFTPAYIDLAKLYVLQKEVDKAAACLEKSLIVTPDSSVTHYALGQIYLLKRQPDKTILHWKKSIELEPDSITIMSGLAELLATYRNAQFRNPEEAIRLAKQCCELTEYKNPVLLNILASAMASANRFAEAIDFAEKALLITRATGQKELTAKILYRLDFYKANQPYIEFPSPK
jgi:Flp pilus assembly protein TadD